MKKRLLLLLWTLLSIYLIPVGLYSAYAYNQRHTPTTIRYTLGWYAGDAIQTPKGWVINTNLNYKILLQEGYLTNSSVQLMPCEHAHGFWGWLKGLLPIALAQNDALSSGALGGGFQEALHELAYTELGVSTGYEARYCLTHYVLAASEKHPQSLWLKGIYQKDNEAPQAFLITASTPFGSYHKLLNNAGEAIEVKANTDGYDLILIRHFGHLFNNIDFDALSDEQIARSVLRNINLETRVLLQ